MFFVFTRKMGMHEDSFSHDFEIRKICFVIF